MYHLPPCMNVKCNKMHIHILLSQCRFPMFSVFVIVSYIPAILRSASHGRPKLWVVKIGLRMDHKMGHLYIVVSCMLRMFNIKIICGTKL